MTRVPGTSPGFGLKWNPQEALKLTALIVFIALALTVIVPGVIALRTQVFFESQVRDQVKDKLEKEMNYAADRIQKNEALVDNAPKINSADAAEGPSVRTKLEKRLDALIASRPLHVHGFINSLTLLFPLAYIGLGCLVFVLPPRTMRWREQWLFLLVAFVCIFVLSCWTFVVRNMLYYAPSEEGRVIFSSDNLDVSPWCFGWVVVLNAGLAFLLAALWVQWADFLKARQRAILDERASAEDAVKEALDVSRGERLSMTFFHWQVCSTMLALAFVYYTYGYWHVVVRLGDHHYRIHAFTMHALWAVSWILISLPLLVTWYEWQERRATAISKLVTATGASTPAEKATLKALQELQPIGVWNLAASSVVAVVSFLWPLVQVALK